METEMQMMDHSMQEDMPVESTTGTSNDEQLMYTTSDDSGVDYQSTLGDAVSSYSDLSGAQVAGIMAIMGVYMVFMLVLIVFSIVTMWKVFTKAGRAGWESIVPIYNIYVTLLIIGRPGWWILLLFIPFVNVVIALFVAIDLAKSFGRSTAFGVVGLFLFSIVGYAILAFGKDTYLGPGGASSPVASSSETSEMSPPAAPAV